jgi:hypothetical protein
MRHTFHRNGAFSPWRNLTPESGAPSGSPTWSASAPRRRPAYGLARRPTAPPAPGQANINASSAPMSWCGFHPAPARPGAPGSGPRCHPLGVARRGGPPPFPLPSTRNAATSRRIPRCSRFSAPSPTAFLPPLGSNAPRYARRPQVRGMAAGSRRVRGVVEFSIIFSIAHTVSTFSASCMGGG